jgi:hypothetical protein
MAHLRNKWRSGDVCAERSSNYRRFDSYLLPTARVVLIAADMMLPRRRMTGSLTVVTNSISN